MSTGDAGSLRPALDWASPAVRRVLGRALDGDEVSIDEGLTLAAAGGGDLHALTLAADELRRRQAGEVVTFVVNRNINFTNVCIKHCTFCAFSRDHRQEEGYLLPMEEVVRRAQEAWDLGATEVCVQAGLPPKLDGRYYIDLCRAIKQAVPEMHLHAFSPEEILYGSLRSGLSIREYLTELKAAGLGTLPGTSAEILDQEIRDVIARGRITVQQWIDVITTAHALGIRTTSTIMYGHIETHAHWVRHMALLRSIQRDTGGFTEFVPLSLIHTEAPMWAKRLVPGVRPGATGVEVVKMHALARLMLGPTFRNIQSSWVKEGPKLAQLLLGAGANDLGGTLINESISTSAGAAYGQLVPPAELKRLVRDAGRVPAQRDTTYNLVRVYGADDDEPSPLDAIEDAESRFGSYRRLIASGEFRYTRR
ncbi:MAG: 7,8-didemethyl-8-hydroxy-5-deazariboflavin synthase subunit CofH [Candidatus Rokubacteria bacterium 13_1_40CM_69_27]|nr:MAG: 7,8-didemethyl-8-hydroxy-5-deazariboflavin synthase subunit CofH [Candidatus Rokubacteria bacterium 13_1_40CM_69_27]OLC31402.1 MAG: 7,8-didemethyl-8-hydroxy-5-deazariboflavin synthase subunit CofH [Candidatus Rokubacteria bacterium 13_1_40CM_4_69_5]OLE38221.1 MAG: 7,8-didemethyl-8-hydroxy-5-deazariboflavin synthase subunit CofH [Candidatus Rokubacteria bacterium 13_1_20CM_2_70_7]